MAPITDIPPRSKEDRGSRRWRWLGRLMVGMAAGILALIAVHIHDRLSQPSYSFEPVRLPSAIDGWQAPWEEADVAAPNDATETRPASAGESDLEAPAVDCRDLPRSWLVIGWDGADWDIILPLVEAGEMPNLAQLMREGSFGSLASFLPSVSPALWTTVATGVSPDVHGIRSFYNQRPRLLRWFERLRGLGKLERDLYSNADRRARAVWNELTDRERSVLLVGYHNTFPVEPVQGVMVSNYLVQSSIADLMSMRADGGRPELALSLVHPFEHLDRVLAIQEEVQAGVGDAVRRFVDLDDEAYRAFLRRSRQLDRDADVRPYFLVQAYVFDTINAEVADLLLPEVEPAVAFVHFQSLDWAAHHFLYFHDPEAFAAAPWSPEVRAELDAELDAYGDTVVEFYRYQDEWLGRLLRHRDAETAVMLLSDHGFDVGIDPGGMDFHDNAPPGILVLAGAGIRAGGRLDEATLYDVLPTLMAGLELPVAQDLRGRVLTEAWCPAAWAASEQTTVASYQTGEPYVPEVARPPELDDELMKQLESLGYLR